MNYEARDEFLASLEARLMEYPKEYLATAVAGAIAAKEDEKSGFIHGFFNILKEWQAADRAAGVYPEKPLLGIAYEPEWGIEYEVDNLEEGNIFTLAHSEAQARKWVAESPTDTGLRRGVPPGPWEEVE